MHLRELQTHTNFHSVPCTLYPFSSCTLYFGHFIVQPAPGPISFIGKRTEDLNFFPA